MKCLRCNGEDFREEKTRFTPEIKGKQVEVVVPSFVCSSCRTPLMNAEQMSMLRRAAADQYRKEMGLLTSEQIVAFRKSLNMSQMNFADYLKVGLASIKRWETYFIQDASQDDHIRLRCEEKTAEANSAHLRLIKQPADIRNGNIDFSLKKFQAVAGYLVKETNEDKIHLNKLHFYADFFHFAKHGQGITGARYTPLKYGPCPDGYRRLYNDMVESKFLVETANYRFNLGQTADFSVLDDSEIRTLEEIIQVYRKLGRNKIFNLAHEEPGYEKTQECEIIKYNFAKQLKLKDYLIGQ